MQYIYFGTVFAAAIIYFILGLLLFLQRKKGERSRMILAYMTFLSTCNYIWIIANFHSNSSYGTVMQVPFLLLGIFVVTIYFMYPIEVVSPRWITWKRLFKMYIPAIGFWLLYRVTLELGVEYTSYKTIGKMVEDIGSFQSIFRIMLALLMFLPAALLYYVPYTRRYNNTDHKWMRGYIAAVVINMMSYLAVNIVDTFLSCSLYVSTSILCSLYITYQELYVRLIRQPIDLRLNEPQPAVEIESESIPQLETDTPQAPKAKESELFERLEKYMNNTQAWQDPDLSQEKLAAALYTNRTSLLRAIKQHGYSSYTSYVNGKRVAEFILIINRQGKFNYLQTFFDVGFRSRATAFRNFRGITGMMPSDYFHEQARNE